MLTVALRVPVAPGSKVTTNVFDPLALTVVASGWVVTVNSEAFVPETATIGVPDRLRSPLPLLDIVKVRGCEPVAMSCEPKSV